MTIEIQGKTIWVRTAAVGGKSTIAINIEDPESDGATIDMPEIAHICEVAWGNADLDALRHAIDRRPVQCDFCGVYETPESVEAIAAVAVDKLTSIPSGDYQRLVTTQAPPIVIPHAELRALAHAILHLLDE